MSDCQDRLRSMTSVAEIRNDTLIENATQKIVKQNIVIDELKAQL